MEWEADDEANETFVPDERLEKGRVGGAVSGRFPDAQRACDDSFCVAHGHADPPSAVVDSCNSTAGQASRGS
jgi:hypothetical protein